MGDEPKPQDDRGVEVLSNQERAARQHVQQSGEQAVRAAAPQQQATPQGAPQADADRVQRAAAEVHAELNRPRGSAPAGAAAGLSLPPELVDQLKNLSQQAIAFIIQIALQKLGSL